MNNYEDMQPEVLEALHNQISELIAHQQGKLTLIEQAQVAQLRNKLGPVSNKIEQRVVTPGPSNPSDGRSRRFATERQLRYIDNLCSEKFARVDGTVSTMLDASQVIAQLQGLEDVPEDERDLSSVPSQPLVTPIQPPEKVKDKLDFNVLRMIPDGRYAVTADSGKQTVFIRLATRKTKGGVRVVQVKSGDAWDTYQTFYPSGSVIGRNTAHGSVIADLLTQIMMDKAGCADRYGERFSECVNCGRELTDDRSRYYRLGSECIQHRADIVEYVNNKAGEWFAGAASRD